MYISPYLETAPPVVSQYAPTEAAQLSALELTEDADINELDPNDDGNSAVGSFAQILAGLLRETSAENVPQQEDGGADGVLLAGRNEIMIEGEPGGDFFPAPVQQNGLLSLNADEIAALADIAAQGADGLLAEELIFAGLSEADENFLISEETPLSASRAALDKAGGVPAESLIKADGAEEAGEESLFAPKPAEPDTAAAGRNAQAADGERLNQKAAGEKEPAAHKLRQADDAALPALAARAAEAAAIEAKNSEGKKGRLEEVRGKERRGERLSVEVRDLRSAQAGAEGRAELRVNAGMERGPVGDTGPREITLELRLPDQAHKAPLSEANWGTKSAHAFEDLLARELHQNFNNDIVRHASMVLQDEGKGMIRLALKPDSLGNVKIRLELAENKITGQIIVESEEALRAFQREVHSLEQAFKESGFQEANLQMSLAADGEGAKQFQQWAQARSLLSELAVASRYDTQEQAEAPLSGTLERGQTIINMLA